MQHMLIALDGLALWCSNQRHRSKQSHRVTQKGSVCVFFFSFFFFVAETHHHTHPMTSLCFDTTGLWIGSLTDRMPHKRKTPLASRSTADINQLGSSKFDFSRNHDHDETLTSVSSCCRLLLPASPSAVADAEDNLDDARSVGRHTRKVR